jgi:hypothetical protein
VLVVAVVFLVALTIDLARPPDRQLSARLLIRSVHTYQWVGHRLIPRGQCRFSPTCSSYAEVVLREHGAVRGSWLAARRLLRCGPWTPEGTKDPPPPVGSKSETP